MAITIVMYRVGRGRRLSESQPAVVLSFISLCWRQYWVVLAPQTLTKLEIPTHIRSKWKSRSKHETNFRTGRILGELSLHFFHKVAVGRVPLIISGTERSRQTKYILLIY